MAFGAKKIIPIKKITSWSFSRLSDYTQCPLKARLKHIERIKEPPNAAMERGASIHTQIEHFITALVPSRLSPDSPLRPLLPELKRLRKRFLEKPETIIVEDTWAFRSDWTKTTYDDWNGCAVRIKLDCAHFKDDTTLIVTDWKTGKYRPENQAEYLEQLDLYALAAFLWFPEVETVIPRLAYVDHGIIWPPEDKPIVYTRDQLPALRKKWEKRVQPMLNDTTFAARPNNFCRWCHFRAENKENGGGQCKY